LNTFKDLKYFEEVFKFICYRDKNEVIELFKVITGSVESCFIKEYIEIENYFSINVIGFFSLLENYESIMNLTFLQIDKKLKYFITVQNNEVLDLLFGNSSEKIEEVLNLNNYKLIKYMYEEEK